MIYKKFLEYNKNWSKETKDKNKDFFYNLSKGQNPQILIIGCSDSRISLEKILGAELGDFFIHRNIANLAQPDDLNFMAVLEYAIEVLRVKHIIVMGHYQCGGIKAALDGNKLNYTKHWIEPLSKLKKDLKPQDSQNIYDQLSEINSLKQIENIEHTEIYQKAKMNNYAPDLHAWVFNIYNGEIKILN